MNSFIVLALCVAVAVAIPIDSEKEAITITNENDNIGVGDYKASHETSNQIKSEQVGQLKNRGSENEAIEVRGQNSYVGPDGITYTVVYIANENGYQPQGAHLPQ